MQSMTGYGCYRACHNGRELTMELKSVNHRFLDISFRLPKNLNFLEDILRTRLNASGLKRGHVDVAVTYQNIREDAREVQLDKNLLHAVSKAIAQIEQAGSDFKRATVADVLSLSGALTIVQVQDDTNEISALAIEAFEGAVASVTDMRGREGEHLADDLIQNLAELSSLHLRISQRAPAVPEEYRKRLQTRLDEWEVGAIDPQRIAQEIAMMADRCAIDEELNRLSSHIAQFEKSIKDGIEIGRKLDFLSQEMNREVNTIGSKASDAELAQLVVEAKCVIEKLREQVQNAV